jgi:hypothetical protein
MHDTTMIMTRSAEPPKSNTWSDRTALLTLCTDPDMPAVDQYGAQLLRQMHEQHCVLHCSYTIL